MNECIIFRRRDDTEEEECKMTAVRGTQSEDGETIGAEAGDVEVGAVN